MNLTGVWSQIRLFREAKLDNKRECVDWCMRVGLIKNSSYCNVHKRERQLQYLEERGYSWLCTKCRDRRSVVTDTIFERTDVSRVLVLMLCFAHDESYESCKRAVVFGEGDEQYGHSTISRWFTTFRQLITDRADRIIATTGQIGGPGKVVQVDEALIGRRKYHRGRVVEQTWVLGMIDEDGELRLEIVDKRDADTLRVVIERHVQGDSVIHSDCWRGYNSLAQRGWYHHTVNHSNEFVAEDGTHTQQIESQWRAMRRKFSAGGIRKEDIGDHLVEYMWRRECRRLGQDPFTVLVRLLRQ